MQNINLYVPELRPDKKFLTAKSLAYSMLACLVLMLSISYFASTDVDKYRVFVQALENKKQAETQSVEQIKENIPKVSVDNIDREITELRSKITYLSRVHELIGKQKLGNELGYSARIADLSTLSDSSFAISSFRFSDGSRKVELRGETLSPEGVTTYVDSLQKQASFEGAKFGPFTLSQTSTKRTTHTFSFGYERVFDSTQKLAEATP